MNSFYSKFTFLLGFLILINIFYMMFGETFTEYFLLLILLGMVLTNTDKFAAVFSGIGG